MEDLRELLNSMPPPVTIWSSGNSGWEQRNLACYSEGKAFFLTNLPFLRGFVKYLEFLSAFLELLSRSLNGGAPLNSPLCCSSPCASLLSLSPQGSSTSLLTRCHFWFCLASFSCLTLMEAVEWQLPWESREIDGCSKTVCMSNPWDFWSPPTVFDKYKK